MPKKRQTAKKWQKWRLNTGYDILCDDGVNEVAVLPNNDEADPNCDRAAKLVKRFGYDVVCGVEEE